MLHANIDTKAALFVLFFIMVGMCCPASAVLNSDEVVVIVNSNVPHSVALGRFYCSKRSVPEKNLIALDLPDTKELSAEQYIEFLGTPLRTELKKRGLYDKVRCLLTVYGVPYLMRAEGLAPQHAKLVKWLKANMGECTNYFKRNIQLMKNVGENLPRYASVDAPLNRFDLLFDNIPVIDENSFEGAGLTAEFASEARKRVQFVREMKDSHKQQLAIRQIIALYVDCYGLDAWNILVSLLGDMAPPIPGNVASERNRLTSLKNSYSAKVSRQDYSDENFIELSKATVALGGRLALYRFSIESYDSVTTRNTDGRSVVDSELALVLWSQYQIENAIPNPLHWRKLPELSMIEKQLGRVLMVSRLDGPDIESVMKMVINSIEAEKTSLQGKLYIDYGSTHDKRYDRMLERFAKTVEDSTKIEMVKNENVLMFEDDDCKDAAMYVGWYSPGNFVDAFEFSTGAVAYHIGKNEAEDFRDPKSNHWVPSLIKDGAVATVGGLWDAGLYSYPAAIDFYPLIYTGELSIAECYWRCVPYVSWRVMLFADPLYNPYKKNPQYYPVIDELRGR